MSIILFVIAVLKVFRIDYTSFNASAKYLSYLLTPATVCLAVPLYAQLEKLRQNPNWSKVDYKGVLPHNEVGGLMEESSAGIALNDYVANVGYKIGSLGNTKLFEYMMAGIPVIATDFVLWKQIVESYDCGTCVNPHDSKAVHKAIEFYINHPEEARRQGDNGRRAVAEKYCWATQEPVLLEMYDKILNDK